jgi:hypothetical protein
MTLKHKIFAVFFIIMVIFFFFYFRKNPENHIVKPPAIEAKNDSTVFWQLKKIVSYQVANSFYKASNCDSALYYYQKSLTDI